MHARVCFMFRMCPVPRERFLVGRGEDAPQSSAGGSGRLYGFPGWRVDRKEWGLVLKISIKLWTGSAREVARFPLEV